MKQANTFFEKPLDKQIIWKPQATQGFAPPWNPERFAELDICIVRDRWKNTVTNVQSHIRTNIDSDHIALHVNIRQKLKKLEEDTPDNSLKGIQLIGQNGDTSDTVLVKYLERAKVYLEDSTSMDEASNALWKASSETLDTRKKGMGKRETHPEIKAILDERQRAINDFDQRQVIRLTQKFKRKAKQIRSKRIIDSFEEGTSDPVKLEKTDFVPRHIRIRNEGGRIVNDREKADAFAEFYEHKQWRCEREEPAEQGMNRTPIRNAQDINTEPVTMQELKEAIHKFKKNKTPGPNGTPIELFQWLDDEALEPLLTHINECWEEGKVTEGMDDANVAVLFKKGSTENPENYRPIALLITTCEILVSIVQRRLAQGMDQAIDEMQFGFRIGRSTSQPLQIVRRTAEIVEESCASMYTLLIDWEKAFDKVDQERLIFALERTGIPQKGQTYLREAQLRNQG